MADDIFDGVSGGLRNFLQSALSRRDGYVRAPGSVFAPGHDEVQAATDFVGAQNAPYGSIAYRNDPTRYGSVASRQMPGQFGTYGAFNPGFLQQQKDDAMQAQKNVYDEEHKQQQEDQLRQSAIGAQFTAQALSPMFSRLLNRPAVSGLRYNGDISEESNNG